MVMPLFKKVLRHLYLVLALLLILLATYLSLGRELFPAISRYKSVLEAQLLAATGIPVSIDSLQGAFVRFDPVITLAGMRLLSPANVGGDDAGLVVSADAALAVDTAQVVIDVPRSLIQRQIVLRDFSIDGVAIRAEQAADGSWRLRGIDTPEGPGLTLADVYDSLARVARLDLTHLDLELRTATGQLTRVEDGTAVIQNRGGRHYFHIDTRLPGVQAPLQLSVELAGERASDLDGMIHLRLPPGDYASALGLLQFPRAQVAALQGEGHLWLSVVDGAVAGGTLQAQWDRLNLTNGTSGTVGLDDFSVQAAARLSDAGNRWTLAVADLEFLWQGRAWPQGDLWLDVQRDSVLTGRADALDLNLLADLALSSGWLEAGVADTIRTLRPRGQLIDVSLSAPLGNDPATPLRLRFGLVDVAVESFNRTPAVAGVQGYLEVTGEPGTGVWQGLAEVESRNFSINIPSVFLQTWRYDQVNGRVDFRVETGPQQRVQVVSNVVRATAPEADGHVQFASDLRIAADGTRDADFTLLVGVTRADADGAAQYLPSAPTQAPNLLASMAWLEAALQSADIHEAGVIFRGAANPGSPPATKTFQSYYDFSAGSLRYAEGWPQVTGASGTVRVRDQHTDIFARRAESAGLQVSNAVGRIRRTATNRPQLMLSGDATGATEDALDFLRTAPLGLDLKQLLSEWHAEGDVQAALKLEIPLGTPRGRPAVAVTAALVDNSLRMDDLALRFDALHGGLYFSTETGFDGSELQAEIFGESAQIWLQTPDTGRGRDTRIEVAGRALAPEVRDWPRQSGLVRDLLARSQGDFAYTATVTIVDPASRPADQPPVHLALASDLVGLQMQLPQPFNKPAAQALALQVEMGLGRPQRPLTLLLGPELQGRMTLVDGGIERGILYLGTPPGVADPWRPQSDRPGLEVRGNLDRFVLTEWLGLLSGFAANPGEAQGLSRTLAQVQVDIGTLDLFGQPLDAVSVRVEHQPQTQYWTISLDGEPVSGSVLVPFDRNDYLDVYLAYLRLPGPTEVIPRNRFMGPPPPPRDPLAGVDPRRFPRLHFHTGAFSVGINEYGLGQFTMEPQPTGARFSNLILNFRGLQAGLETDDSAELQWTFDGKQHRSELTGVITSGNLAEVLSANGYAPSLESRRARFDVALDWPGSPLAFRADGLSGTATLAVEEGRFLQAGSGSSSALKFISILNFDAIMRRARFSDDLLRRGLAYDDITGSIDLAAGIATIRDRVIISGPSSVYQITGRLDLGRQTIDGEMYLTLPVSDNIPWLGLLTANIPLAIGAYLFDQIFGDQVDSLTSAQYTLQGPWEGLQPQFKQAFGTPEAASAAGVLPVPPGN